MIRPRSAGLWRHRDFRQLWAAETISQLGTRITLLALPVLAVTLLAATPLEMGVLTALETAAFLLVGLPAGAWVDRWRRKRVLVASDLVRAAAMGSLPIAWLLDALTLQQVLVVAAISGTATVFFDVAYQSYLPTLVDRSQIVDGNGRLEMSRAVAQVAGPGITGVLLRWLGAPLLLAGDALSFLLSALFIGRIRQPDAVPDRSTRRPLRAEIAEGLSFVLRHPLLRRIVACTGTSNLFSAVTGSLLVLFALRTLGLSGSAVGFVFSAGAVGGLIGAVTAAGFARWVGEGRAIPLAVLLVLPFTALTPLAAHGAPVLLLVLGSFGISWGVVVYNVTQVSFRQRLCPPALLGRMNASVRFIVFGTIPLGACLAGCSPPGSGSFPPCGSAWRVRGSASCRWPSAPCCACASCPGSRRPPTPCPAGPAPRRLPPATTGRSEADPPTTRRTHERDRIRFQQPGRRQRGRRPGTRSRGPGPAPQPLRRRGSGHRSGCGARHRQRRARGQARGAHRRPRDAGGHPGSPLTGQPASHSGAMTPADTMTAGPVSTVVPGSTRTESRPPGTSTTTVPAAAPAASRAA